MENSAWASVGVRLFAFSVLPVLLASLHVRLDSGAKGRLRTVEVYLIYLFMLGVAAGGLSGFFGHVFMPDTVAESIDWPKGNPFQQEMVFRQTDDAIGRFVSRARPDDLILFISDHGFQSCTRTVHMDHLLKQFGYLEFSASNVVFGPMQWGPVRNVARKVYDMLGLHGKVSLPQSVNWSKTKAFTTIRSTGEGVSINLAGREIDGIVDPGDYEKVRDEVMDRLGSFVDPKTGKKPIKAIHKREEIFKGEFADRAPDIMMVPAEGYSLAHAKSPIEDADWVSGDHRLEGTIVAVGPEREAVRVAAGADRHGADDRGGAGRAHRGDAEGPDPARDRGHRTKALTAREAAPSVQIPGMGESAVSDTEADEMEEHLRGLGYIE